MNKLFPLLSPREEFSYVPIFLMTETVTFPFLLYRTVVPGSSTTERLRLTARSLYLILDSWPLQ